MARVPVATQPSTTERPLGTPYRRLDAPAAAFGLPQAQARARQGQSLMAAGEVLGNIVVQRMREDNERKAKDIDNQYVIATDRLDHGDGTPDNPGFFNLLGQDAEDGYSSLAEKRRKLRNDLLAGAGPTVQKLAGDSMTARDISAGRQYAQHLGRQRRVAQQATSEARIDLAARTAQNNYSDPAIFNDSLRVAAAEAVAQADRMGLVGPAAAEMVLRATSPVVSGAAAAALTAGNTVAAEAIFAQHSAKMTAPARLQLAKVLKDTTDRRLAEEKTQAIMRVTGGNLAQGLQLIQGLADPAQREEVTRRFVNQVNLQERARAQQNTQTLDRFKRIILETGSTDVIPPEEFSRADPDVVAAAMAFEANWARHGSIFPQMTEPAAREELQNLLLRDPEKFVSMDLSPYQSRIAESEYKTWQGRQLAAVKTPAQAQASYGAARAMANSFANELLVKNPAGRGALATAAEAEADRALAAGEPLDREKVRAALRQVAVSGRASPGMFGGMADALLGTQSGAEENWLDVAGTDKMPGFIFPGSDETVGEMADALGLPPEEIILRINSLLARGAPVTRETLGGQISAPAGNPSAVSLPMEGPQGPEFPDEQKALREEAIRLLEFNKIAVNPANLDAAMNVLREHRGR